MGVNKTSMSTVMPRRHFAINSGALALSATTLEAAPPTSLARGNADIRAATSAEFNPPAGYLAGKTVLITGANSGLGFESAKRLRRVGANVVVTARTAAKVNRTVQALQDDDDDDDDDGDDDDATPLLGLTRSASDIGSGDASRRSPPGVGRVVGVELDLASLSSIKTFPARLVAAASSMPSLVSSALASSASSRRDGDGNNLAIDVLLNNAGVMALPRRLDTADGFERQVGVNHLGHFALTGVLLPFLKRAGNADEQGVDVIGCSDSGDGRGGGCGSGGGFRVVTVASEAHRFASAKDLLAAIDHGLEYSSVYSPWGQYSLSKALNILFTTELQRRLQVGGVRGSAVCLHPGVVRTDLGRYLWGAGPDGNGAVGGSNNHPLGSPTSSRITSQSSVPERALGGIGQAVAVVADRVLLPVSRGANTQVFLAAGGSSSGGYGSGGPDYAASPGAVYFDNMRPAKPSAAATDARLAWALWEASQRLTGVRFLDEE